MRFQNCGAKHDQIGQIRPTPELSDRCATHLERENGVLRRLAALKAASNTELKREWRTLFDNDPPVLNRAFLESLLAYRLQEISYGGLKPQTVERLMILGEKLDGGHAAVRRLRADNRPVAGTRLVREYRGVEHVVTVLREGFEYEGRSYQSLSAIARHITSTRWNGWLFFDLRSNRSGT